MNKRMIKRTYGMMMVLAGGLLVQQPARGDDAATVVLPDVTVVGESTTRFLPPVSGVTIFDGKKAERISFDNRPALVNNNYRQALDQTPGLLVSEESSPLLSLGYRGLPPHRVMFTQVMQDGVPIHADMFGYPEAYYTPPLEAVSHIEFIRGGASLMYGPQPGGALNYVTRNPRTDVTQAFHTRHTIGSDGFYSTFNSVEGTTDDLGYLAWFHHRQGDGFREANSDFDVYAGRIKLVLPASERTRWNVAFDAYEEQHGEPGGLTLATGPDTVNYRENRKATSRFHDRFELQRYAGVIGLEHDISDDTLLELKAFGGYYSRYSRRQRGGGFGTLPTGPDANSNTIELQEFYTAATEGRLRHGWSAWDHDHTLIAGAMVYHVDSPRTDKRGTSPTSRNGKVVNESDRSVYYVPVFVENRFVFGDWSATPGVRVENIWQEVKEKVNASKTKEGVPLGSKDEQVTVPLFGLGLAWKALADQEFYANASQSYRPTMYTETVPTGGTTLVPEDLDPSEAVQFDLGWRGRAGGFLTWDASVFQMNFRDQVGSIALDGGFSTLANVGKSRHRGVEAAVEVDVSEVIDITSALGALTWFGNVMLLDAEFTSGPQEGKTPQYAPDYLVRSGIRFAPTDRLRFSFSGTMVGEHFADDANKEERAIPSYAVWDLSAEATIYRDTVSVFAGINNVFDRDYYARIRNDGIDPAAERNYFAGVKIDF